MVTRKQIEKAIAQMPESFHADELIEKLILLEKINEGLSDSDNKRVTSHEKVKKQVEGWFR